MNFEQFYKDNLNRHIRKIARIIHDDIRDPQKAFDIVQEAYTKAWAYRSTYDETRGTVDKWFNRILYNTLHDSQREFQALAILEFDVEEVEQEEKRLFPLLSALKLIRNKRQREIVALYYGFGYNTREISDLMGVTQTNVTTTINRFREKIKQNGDSI